MQNDNDGVCMRQKLHSPIIDVVQTNDMHKLATDNNDMKYYNDNKHISEPNGHIIDVSVSTNEKATIMDNVCNPRNIKTSSSSVPIPNEEPAQMRKLFIGGLDYKTSEDTLRQHFEKFGEVIDCIVMREPQSRKSRGFGFVTYAKSYMVDKAQEARPHHVDGREVEPKRAIPRGESGKLESQATVKKVFLGGLTDDLTELDLRNHFKDYGNIVNINIATQKDTGKKRGFAFVEFDDYDPVDKIVLKKHHLVKETRLEVKKAIPKIEMDARRVLDPRMSVPGPMPHAMMNFHPQNRNARMRNNGYVWDNGHYSIGNQPVGYPTQSNYGYQMHYQTSGHYDAGWMMYNHGSGPQGSIGPMRTNYQHRSAGPYGGGFGSGRNRNYNQ